MRQITLSAVAIFALALAGAPPVAAQAQQQAPGTEAPSFSDDQLESFVVALTEVRKINDEYMPMFQAASTAEEKKKIQDEANEKMVEAIRAGGISVETYNQIFAAAQADPQLTERINRRVQETQ